METRFFFFSKKFEIRILTLSPTLVIDTSTERSSRVLQHGNQNFFIFFFKVRNWIRLVFRLVLKSWNHSSRSQHAPICRHRGCTLSLWGSTSSCISPSSGEAYSGRQLTPNFDLELNFFVCRHVSMWGFQNPVCLSVPREKKTPWLRQYQSYISNWYINRKVFMSTKAWKPKNLNLFSKKFEIEFWPLFWLVLKSWNHLSFVNISSTLVNDTRMERSSQVL